MRVLGVLLGGVVAAACGARPPPEPLEPVENVGAPTSAGTVTVDDQLIAMPRPDIDVSFAVPDFHDELRWPLTGMNHPTLEPRFPIAQQLAIDVDWQQLCARGVQNRTSATQKELLGYLRGWCEAQKRDIDAACANLSPLLSSLHSGLRPAVRQDLANILVDHGDAGKAEHWLSKHHIRDIATLDLLAANYVEVGSLADASAINRRAIDSDDYATHATMCTRLTKSIVLGHDLNEAARIDHLKTLAVKPKAPDPTCRRLWNKVSCWRDQRQCGGYLHDENVAEPERKLVAAYSAWPAGHAKWHEWWNYADTTRLAVPAPGAAELVVTAMEAALRAHPKCGEAMAIAFRENVAIVRHEGVTPELEQRLQVIEKACPASPDGFRATPP